MLLIKGAVREVVTDKSVRGAFGQESALLVKVQAHPDADYTDYVYIPDTEANRRIVRPGFAFESEVTAEAVAYKGSAFLSLKANYRADVK